MIGETEDDLPSFTHDGRKLRALQGAMYIAKRRRGMTQKMLANLLDDFAVERPDKYPHAPRPIIQQHISEIRRADEHDRGRGYSHEVATIAWDWFREKQLDDLKEEYFDPENYFKPFNNLPIGLHALFNGYAPYDAASLKRMQGRFVLIRRFFLDPELVLISELTIGSDLDASSFRMISVYTDETGNVPTDTVKGYVAPFGDHLFLQGWFEQMQGPFSAVLKDVRKSGEVCNRAEGLMLAAPSAEKPSAFPVFLLRDAEDIEAGVYSRKDLPIHGPILKRILPILDRLIIEAI